MPAQVQLGAFASSTFDAVAWVDELTLQWESSGGEAGAAAGPGAGDGEDADGADRASKERRSRMESQLAETEVRLQLMAEEVAGKLEGVTAQAAMRLPGCLGELKEAMRQAAALREDLVAAVDGLNEARTGSGGAVDTIRRVHERKQALEEARLMLTEAAALTELMSTIDDTFNKGDIVRSAEALCAMRRGLEVVGDSIPELAAGRTQLGALEQRLKADASPAVGGAIRKHNGPEVARLTAAMAAVGHPRLVGDIYVEETVKTLASAWKSTVFRSALSGDPAAFDMELCLGKFYDELLGSLEKENRWLSTCIPDERVALLVGVVDRLHRSIKDDFATCADRAMGPGKGGGAARGGALKVLMALHAVTTAFARNAVASIRGADEEARAAVTASIFSPYESHLARYPELERQELSEAFAAFAFGADDDATLQAVAQRVEESVAVVVTSIEDAVGRCISFTGAAAFDALPAVLDDVICEYTTALHVPLKGVASRLTVGESAGAQQQQHAVDESFVQGSVNLLNTATSLTSRLKLLDASIRLTILDAVGQLVRGLAGDPAAAPAPPGGLVGPATQAARSRLAADAERLGRLRRLHEQLEGGGFNALKRGLQRVQVFAEATENLMEGVILQPARSAMYQLARLPVWTEREAASVASYALSTFSAYPQEAVTTLGEYLLTVPTILEPLTERAEEDEGLTEMWVSRIADGASQLYWSEMASLPALSEKGAAQAVADLDYFINVLLALSVKPSFQMLTYATVLHRHVGDDADGSNAIIDGELDAQTSSLARRQVEAAGGTLRQQPSA